MSDEVCLESRTSLSELYVRKQFLNAARCLANRTCSSGGIPALSAQSLDSVVSWAKNLSILRVLKALQYSALKLVILTTTNLLLSSAVYAYGFIVSQIFSKSSSSIFSSKCGFYTIKEANSYLLKCEMSIMFWFICLRTLHITRQLSTRRLMEGEALTVPRSPPALFFYIFCF